MNPDFTPEELKKFNEFSFIEDFLKQRAKHRKPSRTQTHIFLENLKAFRADLLKGGITELEIEKLAEFAKSHRKKKSKSIKEIFEGVRNDPNQRQITRDYLEQDVFFPKHKVEAGGKIFYLSDIISDEKDLNRQHVLMFTGVQEKGVTLYFPRMIYRSCSDGTWRATLGVALDKYFKGSERHYTQETKLHPNILERIEKSLVANKNNTCDVMRSFKLYDFMVGKVLTFLDEASFYDDKGALKGPQKYMPIKEFKFIRYKEPKIDPLDYSKECNKLPPGFIPDFSKRKRKVSFNHLLLGPAVIEIYGGGHLGGREVDWFMAYDKSGRVWVDGIRFTDVGITTYGTPSEIIDSGGLTMKPCEYCEYTMRIPEDYIVLVVPGPEYPFVPKDIETDYLDITLLLDLLDPVIKFRKVRGINRKVRVEKVA